MAKITGLFFTVLFFCYMLTLTHSARPEPAFHKESVAITQHQDVEADEENCEGVGVEECLMRRTLAAHTDYIYTQKHHNP